MHIIHGPISKITIIKSKSTPERKFCDLITIHIDGPHAIEIRGTTIYQSLDVTVETKTEAAEAAPIMLKNQAD